jgi:hypothetical protein
MRARTITMPQCDVDTVEGAFATDRWREVREGGVRYLILEVSCAIGGRYGVYADLCDENDEEVGYVRREVELDAGVSDIAIRMVVDGDVACGPVGLRLVRRT